MVLNTRRKRAFNLMLIHSKHFMLSLLAVVQGLIQPRMLVMTQAK